MAESDNPCRRVLLIRHGHYDRVGDLGDLHWNLSPLGRRQAARSGRRLAHILAASDIHFEGFFVSPWPRAVQTAEISAHEVSLGRIKVKPYLHEVAPLVDPSRLDLGPLPPGLTPTAPEQRDVAHAQIERVRGRFFTPPRRSSIALLFSHGNLIRFLVARTLGLPYEAWAMMDIAHTGITELRVYSTGFEALISFNETGHLPPSMVTTT